MRQNYLAYATGIILGYIGIVILVPIIAAVFYKEYTSIIPFLSAGLFAMLGGFLVKKSIKPDEIPENLNDIKKAEALFIVASAWVIFGLIAAIPYLFYNLHPLNALFEAVSGITTTGATILTDFNYPHAFFFWRALTQWLGGLGIIVLFIAILPQFAVAGRQMFFAEAPGPIEDKFTPRIRNTASALWKIYTVITVILFILLVWANMPCFDALCTALTTLSAGGFSNNANSIMGYNSFNICWIVIIFMFISGINFNLLYNVIHQKNILLLFKNQEFKTYLSLVLLMSGLIAISLHFHNAESAFENITNSLFQVISITTSTGAASVDFEKWNFTSKMLLFMVMFMGSCASSAGGGIKMARWIVVFKSMKSELVKILHPNAIVNIKLDNKTVTPEVSKQIVVFVFFYFLILGVSAVIISIIEQNSSVGMTSALSSISNIGPGISHLTGPMGNYAHLAPLSKIIMIFNMLVGRLELIPFLVFLQPDFWSLRKNI